jgi:hypothetical protein
LVLAAWSDAGDCAHAQFASNRQNIINDVRKLLFIFVSPGFCKSGLAPRDDELEDLPRASPLLPFFDQARSLLLNSYAYAVPDFNSLILLISDFSQPSQKFAIHKFLLYIQQKFVISVS